MIKSEVEETADDVKIKVEMENDDSVTSFSLENITKTEIKHEDEDHEDTSDCFTDESQDFELKTEELIIKDESEAASTSSATQTDSSHDDKHAAVSDEVERLLAQLRPKKKTIKGMTRLQVKLSSSLNYVRSASSVHRQRRLPIHHHPPEGQTCPKNMALLPSPCYLHFPGIPHRDPESDGLEVGRLRLPFTCVPSDQPIYRVPGQHRYD